MVKVGINGFGRIGRNVLRAALNNPDIQITLVIGGNMVKILAWYDNEWGFSNRLVDLALMMAKRES
ncbi:TPA: hypothetical protein MIA67_09190 [Klebsiella pneumoniae]|nr:hypothetical protein [Klebsiella pneumoniae]HBX6849943.1 hypothetical protein [Klebsiella pneumoniae]